MLRLVSAASVAIFLAGCGPSREQMLDAAHNDCFAYGFDQGTPEYRQCMMAKDGQYQQMEMQRRANVQRGLANMQRQFDPPSTTCVSGRDAFGQVVTRCQ